MSLLAVLSTKAMPTQSKKILGDDEYTKICTFVEMHKDELAIDIELRLNEAFPDVYPGALRSILEMKLCDIARSNHWRYEAAGKTSLKHFEKENSDDATMLARMASHQAMTPTALCRAVLQVKYPDLAKPHLTRMIKYPSQIDDPRLASNVSHALSNDTQDGPLVDLRRRLVGEEYEYKMKELAAAAGLHFSDENDLRRLGYDKTPDIRMLVPFLYRGEVVNWIESKAVFGDVKSHKKYFNKQLNSYCNRFGPGLVIYWYGYHVDIVNAEENANGIIVTHDFPDAEDIETLNSDETESALPTGDEVPDFQFEF